MTKHAAFLALVLAFLAQSPVQAHPSPFEGAAKRIRAIIEAVHQQPGSPPAMAVIMVDRQHTSIALYGVRDARSTTPVNADTPFYIASATKAYTGLLAARLDVDGVFPLTQSLNSVWPDLRFAAPLDGSAITFRELLTHSATIANSTLVYRTSFTDRVPLQDYASLLERYSQPRPAGFEYSNLGDVLYAAALEVRSGRDYRRWLHDDVLAPLRLGRTSSRTSDFPERELAFGHVWTDRGWRIVPPKPDALMNAAGGLVTAPRDMATWLHAHVNGVRTGIPAAAFRLADAAIEQVNVDRGGLLCSGYALGWYVCRYDDLDVLSHGGGYTGYSMLMTVAPSEGAGVAVLANADTATFGLTSTLTREFLDTYTGRTSPKTAHQIAVSYERELQTMHERDALETRRQRGAARWAGWKWNPSRAELASYAGRYRSDRLGTMAVVLAGDRLVAKLGYLDFELEPAAPNLFGATTIDDPSPMPFSFVKIPGHSPTVVRWGTREFTRF